MDLDDEGTSQNFETEKAVAVQNIDEKVEVETEDKRRYPSKQRHNAARYEPTFQGNKQKYGDMLLNYEDTLGSMMTKSDEI